MAEEPGPSSGSRSEAHSPSPRSSDVRTAYRTPVLPISKKKQQQQSVVYFTPGNIVERAPRHRSLSRQPQTKVPDAYRVLKVARMNVRSHIAVVKRVSEETLDAIVPQPTTAANGQVPSRDTPASKTGTDPDSALLEAYLSRRSALIAQEQSLRYDAAKTASLSQAEKEANQIVARVRKEESERIWDVPEQLSTFSGMPFYRGLSRIRSATLFKIIQKMPKGALLHCHMDGTVDARFLIDQASQTPGMHMRASEPLDSPRSLRHATVEFKVLPPNSLDSTTDNIYDPLYTASAWVPYAYARATFPYNHTWTVKDEEDEPLLDHLIPPPAQDASAETKRCAAFDSFVQSLMTMAPTSKAEENRNSKEAWAKFITTFGVAAGLLGYEPTLKEYVKEMCRINARDGVKYIESRVNFFEEFMVRANGQPDLPHREWVRLYDEAVTEVREELKGQGIDFWDARIIYSTVRIIDNSQLRLALEDCRALKKEFPHRIIGFDLVGHEDPGTPLKTYIPELLRFKREQSELGLDEIPYILHAGETLADGDHVDDNLYDALLLGTKRIGHGYSLAQHPLLMQMCKDAGVLIEVCPISNEILGYTPSVAAHPCTILLNNGVPISLSSDDPCQFGNFGLSYDYFELICSSYSTQLSSLYVLVHQSIAFSQMDESEKQEALAKFDKDWAAFVQWIISEFGGDKAQH
ncbi:hypothetical protein CF326_g100 [Tilletia indica]|nr:hypothetical protein CF326_g100 [Tilletia indica]